MSKQFHLALFLPSLAGGGAEKVTLNLARGLIQAGVRVDVVVGQATGPYLKSLPAGANLVNLGARRTVLAIFPLIKYLRTERPDGLISALDHANVVALMAAWLGRTGVKVVVATHSHLSSARAVKNSKQRSGLRWLMRFFYPRAHAIVAVSHGVAEDLAGLIGVAAANIKVVYNPVVDAEMLTRAGQPASHPWLAETAVPVILSVGRLSPPKDFQTLIAALALVRAVTPARLIILGEGELRESLEATIRRLNLSDWVQMPGFCANPYSFMAQARVLALSSRSEALPTVLIEALACGTPVVATNCPGGAGEILGGGKYGRLVPVGDAAALADALLATIQAGPRPPAESWQPYRMETATQAYRSLFETAAL